MSCMNGWTGQVGLLCCLSSACASSATVAPPPAEATPLSEAGAPFEDAGPAPTYTELFAKFFAPGTRGHCATTGCHADPDHNVWLCGTTKETCYAGMVAVGLIDPAHPQQSMIAVPSRSPLVWINSAGGNMPLDAQNPDPAGRDAITAWVRAGAPNN